MERIRSGEAAFQRALAIARARGGPAADIDAMLLAGTIPPPRILTGEPLSPMTLGIQRLLQKRAAMPEPLDSTEVLLFFTKGPAVAALFAWYDEEKQTWTDDARREEYADLVRDVDHFATDESAPPLIAWLNRELSTFTRLSSGEDDDTSKASDKRAGAGASGSRVGWWLRCMESICAHYAAACPPGKNLAAWAVWEFPINPYLAMMPASMERQGIEVAEHYAVTEARKARRKAKQEPSA